MKSLRFWVPPYILKISPKFSKFNKSKKIFNFWKEQLFLKNKAVFEKKLQFLKLRKIQKKSLFFEKTAKTIFSEQKWIL